MLEEGKNKMSFINFHEQMKVPHIIHADLEEIIKRFNGCDLPEDMKQKSFIEKNDFHEACGFAYTVVRSDGKTWALTATEAKTPSRGYPSRITLVFFC